MSEKKLNFTVETLETKHIDSVVNLFIQSFCHAEPITEHLQVSEKEYRLFAADVTEQAVRDGLSTVALDSAGKLIAFIIVEDIAKPFQPNESDYPTLIPVFRLLDELSAPFVDGKTYACNKVAHFWIAGVEKAYMGQGMFTQLNDITIQRAADKGYDFAYAEFTNPISEKVTHNFKTIELCNRINYADFRMANGQIPFQGVKGGAAAYCAAIRPGVKLDSLKKYYTVEA